MTLWHVLLTGCWEDPWVSATEDLSVPQTNDQLPSVTEHSAQVQVWCWYHLPYCWCFTVADLVSRPRSWCWYLSSVILFFLSHWSFCLKWRVKFKAYWLNDTEIYKILLKVRYLLFLLRIVELFFAVKRGSFCTLVLDLEHCDLAILRFFLVAHLWISSVDLVGWSHQWISSVDLVSGSSQWISGSHLWITSLDLINVDLIIGSHLWISSVDLVIGCHCWIPSVDVIIGYHQCGSHLWILSVDLTSGSPLTHNKSSVCT